MDDQTRINLVSSYIDGDFPAMARKLKALVRAEPTMEHIGEYVRFVIERKLEAHYPSAQAWARQLVTEFSTGHSMEAILVALRGDTEAGIEQLVAIDSSIKQRPGRVTGAEMAVMLAVECGRPELAPRIAITSIAAAWWDLRAGHSLGDPERATEALNAILDTSDPLELLTTPLASPCGWLGYCPHHWVLFGVDRYIGPRIFWYTDRRSELDALLSYCGVAQASPAKGLARIIGMMESGLVAEAIYELEVIAHRCVIEGREFPTDWTRSVNLDALEANQRDEARQACEDFLQAARADTFAMGVIYQTLWAPLLEEMPVYVRKTCHAIVSDMLCLPAARLNYALALEESGELADAAETARPLLGELSWGRQAREIIARCSRGERRSKLRVL